MEIMLSQILGKSYVKFKSNFRAKKCKNGCTYEW